MDELGGGRFGSVSKAAFLIGKSQKKDGSWEFIKPPAEVTINPSSLKIGTKIETKKEEGVATEETEETAASDGKVTPKGIPEQILSMKLTFNIVEAYEQKTKGVEFGSLVSAAKSLIGKAFNGEDMLGSTENVLTELVNKTDFTNLSVLNKDLCCYSPLLEASRKQVPVVFYWGNMVYAGVIVSFQTTFNYFSSQGAPLGADVSMSMSIVDNDKEEKIVSLGTKKLLGLIEEGGKFIRQLPG